MSDIVILVLLEEKILFQWVKGCVIVTVEISNTKQDDEKEEKFMIREVSLEEISDGKLYGLNDLVKADCHDCKGCSACCQGMGKSIVLDPLDVHRIVQHLKRGMAELLSGPLELSVVDGIVLPNLSMNGVGERCAFLDEAGRCSIHPYRPGICRLFPLGRYYEEDSRSFRYFLQVHECRKENRTKVKVKHWIDTPDTRRYDQFIADWHFFLKDLQAQLADAKDEGAKEISIMVLKKFYLQPFDGLKDFYEQFYERMWEERGKIEEK